MSNEYKQYREALEKEQAKMDYADIRAEMSRRSEHITELDNLPKQNHDWTDRGLKYTCENAGHPYHEAWKKRKPMV